MRNIVSSLRLYHTAVSASLFWRRFCASRPSRIFTCHVTAFIIAQHHHWRPLTLTALGCSAVGVGVFNQHESFKPTNKTLVENPYSSLKQTGDKAHGFKNGLSSLVSRWSDKYFGLSSLVSRWSDKYLSYLNVAEKWTQIFQDILRFATIKGEGHSAGVSKPKSLLVMLKAFFKKENHFQKDTIFLSKIGIKKYDSI